MTQIDVGISPDNTVVVMDITRPNGTKVTIPLTLGDAQDIASKLVRAVALISSQQQVPHIIVPPGS